MIHVFKDRPISTILFVVLIVSSSFFLVDKVTPDKIPLKNTPRIIDIYSDDALDILTNNNSEYPLIFLFSRETCPSCVESYPVISKVFNTLPIEFSIFYYDTDKNRNTKTFKEIINMLNIETVPTIVIVRGNKILAKIDNLDILMDAEKLNQVIRGVYPQ